VRFRAPYRDSCQCSSEGGEKNTAVLLPVRFRFCILFVANADVPCRLFFRAEPMIFPILDDAPFELAGNLSIINMRRSLYLLGRRLPPEIVSLQGIPQGLSPLRLLPSVMHYERSASREFGWIKQAGSLHLRLYSTRWNGRNEAGCEAWVGFPEAWDGFELRLSTWANQAASFVIGSVSQQNLEESLDWAVMPVQSAFLYPQRARSWDEDAIQNSWQSRFRSWVSQRRGA
jgi:hypothetical protein